MFQQQEKHISCRRYPLHGVITQKTSVSCLWVRFDGPQTHSIHIDKGKFLYHCHCIRSPLESGIRHFNPIHTSQPISARATLIPSLQLCFGHLDDGFHQWLLEEDLSGGNHLNPRPGRSCSIVHLLAYVIKCDKISLTKTFN